MTRLRLHGPDRHVLKTCRSSLRRYAERSLPCRCAQLLRKLVLFSSVAMVMGWQSPGHTRGLDIDEQHQAGEMANREPWPANQSNKQESHPLGTQTLFIERQEDKKVVLERIARVYQYDYTSQSARLLVIDLGTQSVIRTLPINSVHLPLNQTEIDFARALLAADTRLMNQLRDEQSQRAVQPFSALSELNVKASIFEPQDENHPCAVSRCALLSLFDATSTVFAIEPIVFLNSLSIGLLQQR